MTSIEEKYIINNELVPICTQCVAVPLLTRIKSDKLIQSANAQLQILKTCLKTNPGLYRMTKQLVESLVNTSNVVIDDKESFINTTPKWFNQDRWRTEQTKKENMPNTKNVTHTLSRLLLTRPCYVHNTDSSSCKTMYDVVFPDATNHNNYDTGGWWSAFSYVSKDGQEVDYKEFNLVYKPYKCQNDNQIHRADKGVCEPDSYVAKILFQHKQAIVDTHNALDNTQMYYIVVSIPELIQILNEIEIPDFESITQLKKWISMNSYLKTYLNCLVKSFKVDGFKFLDQQSVQDDTLISIIQYQKCVSFGHRVVWMNEEVPWCSFVHANAKSNTNYCIMGKIEITDKHNGMNNVHKINNNLPENFPKCDEQYVDQYDIDYKEKIFKKCKNGVCGYERYYCVILTFKELELILERHEHDKQIHQRLHNNSDDDYDDYYDDVVDDDNH